MNVTANDTTSLAAALLQAFQGREDRLAVANTAGFSPEELDRPLSTGRLAREHLSGRRCLAFYIMRPDNKVTLSCLDLDSKSDRPDPAIRAKVEVVIEALSSVGIRPLVELSQSGSGVHIWVFFDAPLEAWLVRAFWRGVVQHVGIPVPEIFPRQDQLKGKGLGNPIRYPLYNRSQFVDPKRNWRKLKSDGALAAIRRVSSAGLHDAADRLGFRLEMPRPSPAVAAGLTGDGVATVSARVLHLLADDTATLAQRWGGDTAGMHDKSRSALAAAIALQLVWRHVPTSEIVAAVTAWCDRIGYEKGRRSDWIEAVVHSAYEHVWKRDDERRLREAAREAFQGLTTDQQRLTRRKIARKQTINN